MMTVEQALNILHTFENGGHLLPDKVDALSMAIGVLEKQIAQKVIKSCPECGGAIRRDGVLHCEHCGQKLDWSEDNDT